MEHVDKLLLNTIIQMTYGHTKTRNLILRLSSVSIADYQ